MKLTADSGSTKTTWLLTTDNSKKSYFYTQGINPFHMDEGTIESVLRNELLPQLLPYSSEIETISFYGAGCTPEKSLILKEILKNVFPNISFVEVASDMLGAAKALFGNQPGIACILGTGSNSCLFDGKDIVDQVPSLGYILGDEGSSAALGRRLISDCLKRQLPESVSQEFMQRYSLTKDIIIENVYRKPLPSRYIAGFSPFLYEKRSIPEVHKLIIQCFSEFFTRNVINYHKPWLPVHFVGSLANSFSAELTETAESLGMTIGKIETSPMGGLVEYHSQPA